MPITTYKFWTVSLLSMHFSPSSRFVDVDSWYREGEEISVHMAGIVVVFDFDKTIIDCDSDNWVVDELGFTDLFNQLLPTMPWNTLMDTIMEEIHSKGNTIGDIAEVLNCVPIHPRIVPAIRTAHALGCELRIVSDANLFFIETILRHLRIEECFSEINTNPGYVDGKGRLRISPYHDFHRAPHGCPLCPPNMCKGAVIERIQGQISNKKLIYLGDGSGDYCPSLKLGHGDYVMPRKGFPVWDLICKNPLLVKAEIHEWTDGEGLERTLLRLIDRIMSEEDNSDGSLVSAADCKFETISMAAHEAFPPVLPVPQ
ncbi:hypothetical protein SAY87_032256 [Trapa incisa]|uniref:Uncharacterized protein n=1 Tax=Trapa incisa TaxID=236973 RepID=A0AAN7GDW6_9MYRT|nr:hypothetical protein SAY87_032256 [Trapa incisa]